MDLILPFWIKKTLLSPKMFVVYVLFLGPSNN